MAFVDRTSYSTEGSNINDVRRNRYKKKFLQISSKSLISIHKTCNIGTYNLGVRFYYADGKGDTDVYDDHFIVHTKYISLKEELLNNGIMRLNKKQYDMEYGKALQHYDSDFCKYKYRPYTTFSNNYQITLNHILSMMIYTNYTQLSCLFSKTYYDNIHDHDNYYHLGKYLKESVHKFGTSIKDGRITTFYHGISEHLLFRKYHNICINCPLSTSSSFEVATNFTNNNHGMIVEFTGYNTKYMSLSWLSDFCYEKEYLFIQNKTNYPLQIVNITTASNGMEYEKILKIFHYYDEYLKPVIHKANDEELATSIDTLLQRCIYYSSDIGTYGDYGQCMLQTYFGSMEIPTHFYFCTVSNPFVFNELKSSWLNSLYMFDWILIEAHDDEIDVMYGAFTWMIKKTNPFPNTKVNLLRMLSNESLDIQWPM